MGNKSTSICHSERSEESSSRRIDASFLSMTRKNEYHTKKQIRNRTFEIKN